MMPVVMFAGSLVTKAFLSNTARVVIKDAILIGSACVVGTNLAVNSIKLNEELKKRNSKKTFASR